MSHMKRWGAVYILVALFGGSWIGQAVSQLAEGDGWNLFLSSTLENWQSEFLQLAVQALLVVGAAGKLFTKGKEDAEQILREQADWGVAILKDNEMLKAKLDELLDNNRARRLE